MFEEVKVIYWVRENTWLPKATFKKARFSSQSYNNNNNNNNNRIQQTAAATYSHNLYNNANLNKLAYFNKTADYDKTHDKCGISADFLLS